MYMRRLGVPPKVCVSEQSGAAPGCTAMTGIAQMSQPGALGSCGGARRVLVAPEPPPDAKTVATCPGP